MYGRFTVQYLIFCLAVAGGVFCYDLFLAEKMPVPLLWAIYAFFVAATWLFHVLALRSSKGDAKVFIRTYMGTSLARIMLYALVIVLYRFTFGKPTALAFALGFMAHYFVFSAFEVAVLLKQLRSQS